MLGISFSHFGINFPTVQLADTWAQALLGSQFWKTG